MNINIKNQRGFACTSGSTLNPPLQLAWGIRMPPNAVFYVQRVVQMEQFMLVLLNAWALELLRYAIPQLYTLCNMQQLSKNLPLSMPMCNCILRLDSACSSPLTMHFFAPRVGVLLNSSFLIGFVLLPNKLCQQSSHTRNGSITCT